MLTRCQRLFEAVNNSVPHADGYIDPDILVLIVMHKVSKDTKREGRNIDGSLPHVPQLGDRALNLDMCPDRKSNP